MLLNRVGSKKDGELNLDNLTDTDIGEEIGLAIVIFDFFNKYKIYFH